TTSAETCASRSSSTSLLSWLVLNWVTSYSVLDSFIRATSRMRGRNRTDSSSSPSRSQQRRDALDILKLAEALAGLTAIERDQVPLSDALRAEAARAGAITQHIARKRQIQYLAKQLRNHVDELEPIRRLLERHQANSRAQAAHLHRIEAWRDRLIAEGDGALQDLVELQPTADSQRLRSLLRQVHDEAQKAKPPRAARELFHLLRDLLASA
ncbi:MAG: ribosome biogenesis factor YjgA, partial [Rhodanobacteraceae bacterium]